MAPKKKRANKHHLGTTANAAITLLPPSPTIDGTNDDDSHHIHKKHMKRRIIIMVWSRRFPRCYEAEFCPDCPPHLVQQSLRAFRESDTSFFSRNTWLTFKAMNQDTSNKVYNPDSPGDMASFMQLIGERHVHGRKINLTIARKWLAVRTT